MRTISSSVPESIHGVPLAEYLSSRFTYFDVEGWKREISIGKITLNGRVCVEPDAILRAGDVISYDGKGIEEPVVDGNFRIIHEDERLVVIDKPGDLPVHPAGRYFNNTLTMMYEARYGVKLFPVHRLDRETSGVLLCAKDGGAAGIFSKALSDGAKEYRAIVRGDFPEGEIRVDMPIGKDGRSEVRKKRKAFEGAPESAVTSFECVDRFGCYSLVACRPETGRLHQIRVHLEYLGFPVLGDKIYGGDERCFIDFIERGMTDDLRERLVLPRCALHAFRVQIYHSYAKKEMIFESPLPTMFTDFINGQTGEA
jgi:23S rRNA pseudouridine955/2504/2580 synthase/23S rRNA pseudouridine1911/1915/1917 synthase